MLSCLFVPPGWSDGNYFSRSGEKFGRGATNVVFSPLEILKSMERGLEMDQAYRAVLIGPFRGIFNMIGHAFVGTYEMVTFWIPQDPILKPTYVYPGLKEYLHEKNDPRVDAPP
ncbi:MAG: exosortase system-associated protein, TIGR04073 family [Candidatus Omnitrophica bacterium]|nr:exosortase system-associated protein, TIGR04073 family [Candidatus Omnitrophota bacterium]